MAALVDLVDVKPGPSLDDYASNLTLSPAVQELRSEAEALAPRLKGRTVWMLNSTARGGGVAEMLPRMIALFRDLGVDARWAVISPTEPKFFELTKRIHNLIHGHGDPDLTADDRALYDHISEPLAHELEEHIGPRDILVVHDPQPAGAGALLKKKHGMPAIWRCHIGLDANVPQTASAWQFLEPYLGAYDHAVFTAPEYMPPFLAGGVSVIPPAIDPWSHKNRELNPTKLMGVLCNSGLAIHHHDVVTPDFEEPALRLDDDGKFHPANTGRDIGLIYRPTITQISRWDRLKGYVPLLDAFVALKRTAHNRETDERNRRRLDIARLVLAGPDAASVQDDPEAIGVLDELCARVRELDPKLRADVAIVQLPMTNAKQNMLMVNALQRCSTVVVQNSIQEGFGLTVTEAMWKERPVLGSSACGIRHQIRDGIDGRRVRSATDTADIANTLQEMLGDPLGRQMLGERGKRRVYEQFLVFKQLARWLHVLAALGDDRPRSTPPSRP